MAYRSEEQAAYRGNSVQDLGVSGVSRSGVRARFADTEDRTVDLGGFLSHNEHLQAGRKRGFGCGWCAKGLGILYADDPSVSGVERVAVVQSNGVNEEGSSTPPLGEPRPVRDSRQMSFEDGTADDGREIERW